MEDNKTVSNNPCDYCLNATGNTCPVRACYEYSRWKNNGKATQNIIDKVEDFRESFWD